MEEPVPVHAWGGGGVAVGVERKSKDTWGGAGLTTNNGNSQFNMWLDFTLNAIPNL